MSELLKDLKNYILDELFPVDPPEEGEEEEEVEEFIFLDSQPDSPDTVIVISEYPGKDYGTEDERRIQIVCRDPVYSTAKTQANAIRDLLSSKNPEQIVSLGATGTRKAIIKSLQSPFKLDVDNLGRVLFCCNYRVVTERD